MQNFQHWVSSIAEAGKQFLTKAAPKQEDALEALLEYCDELCTSKGEAMGTAIAHEVVGRYNHLDGDLKLAFFQRLSSDYCVDKDGVFDAAQAYNDDPSPNHYLVLVDAIESKRLRLFRRINMAPKGTATIVQMRKDLSRHLKQSPELKSIDVDLKHLLISWFNRGFLELKQISWHTPAHILEKLIAYEAVHEMNGWDDLRRRLADDRRCFAFFHPSLADEPLIFVQVALVKGIATSVQELLEPNENPEIGDADTAIFYSISNCQTGLNGISFGNFLIKQVVRELQKELPQLKHFATLSPIPGFRKWLVKAMDDKDFALASTEVKQLLQTIENSDSWMEDSAMCAKLQPLLMKLCVHYLYHEKRNEGPLDPVARFHLGNGASIGQLNWMGDISENGVKQSTGLLVNYLYELDKVEENHEAFANENEVAVSSEIKKLLT
ncbi:MAG: malonyl-CoA decarboxylase [Cellvibrionaceae bacterium]